jgi:hypothetical protein
LWTDIEVVPDRLVASVATKDVLDLMQKVKPKSIDLVAPCGDRPISGEFLIDPQPDT